MEMTRKSTAFDKYIPILTIMDGVIVSKRGEMTVGWEVSLPPMCAMTEDGYEDMLEAFSSAVRSLGPGYIVHRQDIYLKDRYQGQSQDSYLGQSYERHFSGREHLGHWQYIFLTHALKDAPSRSISSSGAFGISAPKGEFLAKDLAALMSKASDFASVLTSRGGYGMKRLDDETLAAMVFDHSRIYSNDGIFSDIEPGTDHVRCGPRTLWAYSISESKALPTILCPSKRSESLSDSSSQVHLSTSAAIGPLLECEHMVNTYIFTINQGETLREMGGRRRRMTSMGQNAENRIAAEELEEFADQTHKESLLCVKAHTNILVWGEANQEQELRGRVSSALSGMNIICVQNTSDTHVLWYSAYPGAAGEISGDNLMTRELKNFLCLGINETFDSDIPDGILKMCDRFRNIPLKIDIQEAAYKAGFIDNYNAFVLGGSGTGKSFFTNYFVRSCYDAGETVFIIDVGDSYEGLCSVIREESGGRDGIYHTWDKDSPITFDAFIGIDGWVDQSGRLQQDSDGVNFLLSFLQTLWAPVGGWNADSANILKQMVRDFVISARQSRTKPVFNDLRQFIISQIAPKVHSSEGYVCDSVQVTKDRFDIDGLILAMGDYAEDGAFGFLLNDRNPKDLFSSRFTVFEVDKLSGINDAKFYSLCILCIMNSFNAKMRSTPGMKVMVIEEAWKAIANETMSGYLAGLWKTARKFQTSAVVVTQQVSDIMSSQVIRDTILQNSSVRILLDQSNNRNSFAQLQELLGLTEHQKDVILSMNRRHKEGLRYRDVFIALGDKKYGVYATEVSPQEAVCYESNKEKKKPFLELSQALGPMGAIRKLTGDTP
jgi:conjugation system TraG family ATPase